MRRLTLILSDLYLPAGADSSALPRALDLPALDWLLRYAQPAERIDDWRRWLAREVGARRLAELPVAQLFAVGGDIPAAGLWLATPVALEVRVDHVRLRDRGLLAVSQEESAEWQQEFARTFGPELRLGSAGERAFWLSGGPRADVATVDPARLLDADIGQALASDTAAARELRRLGTEIEMWLHSAATNAARERAGRRRISALWLWGGGASPSPVPGANEVRWVDFRIHGGDPCVGALENLGGSQPSGAMPAGFAELAAAPSTVVEFAPMSGAPSESLTVLETHWFEPARAALSEGRLDLLTIVANDRVFRVRPRQGWKFWRRRRSWLQSLGA
jgi:hypothetical protein